MEAFLTLALIFVGSFIVGYFMERMKVPWVFGALLIGLLLSWDVGLVEGLGEAGFNVLAEVGMLLLLFLIGLEIDVKELLKSSGVVVKGTLFIILSEALVGSVLIHYLFGYPWEISALVALSFATVGEAVLVPILEESRAVNTRIGRYIVGVGTLDDVIELATIVWVSALVGGAAGHAGTKIWTYVLALCVLFFLTAAVRFLKRLHIDLRHGNLGAALPVAFFFLFLFVSVGSVADIEALAAILSGIAIRTFLPPEAIGRLLREVRAVTFGFFAPIFFFWVGVTTDMGALSAGAGLVFLVVAVTALVKVLATILASRGYLTLREALTAGVGLSVRFSTSIVVLKLLHDVGLIGQDVFSVLVGATAVFTFLVPLLFSHMLRWSGEGAVTK